jgi:hypothetical protein
MKETHEQHKTKIDTDEFSSGTTNITLREKRGMDGARKEGEKNGGLALGFPQPHSSILISILPQATGKIKCHTRQNVNFFGLVSALRNNPTPNHIAQLQKMAFLLPYDAPPLGFFWPHLRQKSSYITCPQAQLGIRT